MRCVALSVLLLTSSLLCARGSEFIVVAPGDTLWSIAHKAGSSVSELEALNNLTSPAVQIGQKIFLPSLEKESLSPTTVRIHSKSLYTVKKGDTVWAIARTYNVTPAALISLNPSLKGSPLVTGSSIRLPIGKKRVSAPPHSPQAVEKTTAAPRQSAKIQAAQRTVLYKEARINYLFQPTHPEYFRDAPVYTSQPSLSYAQRPDQDTFTSYKEGLSLLKEFNQSIARRARMSNALSSDLFVLDPGHGGRDPGAIVANTTGNHKQIYLVENEYVYDITLRLYRFLKQNGAAAGLTILSPNHLIRNNLPSETLVNQANEVYNSSMMNKEGRRPLGVQSGLDMRSKIAAQMERYNHKTQNVFISLHADNTVQHGSIPTRDIFYYSSPSRTDMRSKRFAKTLVKYFPRSQALGRDLGVLRNNQTPIKILIEIRNFHYQSDAWAIRNPQIRESDAILLGKALIKALQ